MLKRFVWAGWILAFLILSACRHSAGVSNLASIDLPSAESPTARPAAATPSNPPTTLPATNTPAASQTPRLPTATATSFYTGPLSPACGQILPLLPENSAPEITTIQTDAGAEERLLALMPETAVPAYQRLVSSPQSVGLVIYKVGDEANGIYLNADRQMPLASLSKLIHLAAYAEAVGQGRLNPLTTVPVADLDAMYLPRLDLGGHSRALSELVENEKVFGEPPAISLQEIPWMMIRHSSNAAADYLHLLLGQETIEATAVFLGLSSQTAPCPWVGQFLTMSNHVRSGSDRAALEDYVADPGSYGRDVMLLTDAYVNNEDFRSAARNRISSTRLPSVETQRYFGHTLNAQGSPRDYAGLMARFAQNGLSNADSSFIARKYLEWPMIFPDNQQYFSNLGYKNGSLPGILTTTYYAYLQGETTPIVLALFYQDLPGRTYQQWRRNLPHDEFARWLLYEPAALPALRAALNLNQ